MLVASLTNATLTAVAYLHLPFLLPEKVSPLVQHSVADELEAFKQDVLLKEEGTGRRQLTTCTDSCVHANDGICDDATKQGAVNSLCDPGTDCTDCAAKNECLICTVDETWYGSCGTFYKKNKECWQDGGFWSWISDTGEICCSNDESKCCKRDTGVVIGVSVGAVVFGICILLSIILCCVCCSCCACLPCNKHNKKKVQA